MTGKSVGKSSSTYCVSLGKSWVEMTPLVPTCRESGAGCSGAAGAPQPLSPCHVPPSLLEQGTGLRALRPRGPIRPERKQRPRAFPSPRELQLRSCPSCSRGEQLQRRKPSCSSAARDTGHEVVGVQWRGENGWRKGMHGAKSRAVVEAAKTHMEGWGEAVRADGCPGWGGRG